MQRVLPEAIDARTHTACRQAVIRRGVGRGLNGGSTMFCGRRISTRGFAFRRGPLLSRREANAWHEANGRSGGAVRRHQGDPIMGAACRQAESTFRSRTQRRKR